MQNRLKSKIAWTAIAALIGFILGNYGLYEVVGLTEQSYQTLVNLVFTVFIALGVFNDPTNSEGY